MLLNSSKRERLFAPLLACTIATAFALGPACSAELQTQEQATWEKQQKFDKNFRQQHEDVWQDGCRRTLGFLVSNSGSGGTDSHLQIGLNGDQITVSWDKDSVDSFPLAAITLVVEEHETKKPVRDQIQTLNRLVAPNEYFSHNGPLESLELPEGAGFVIMAYYPLVPFAALALQPFEGIKTRHYLIRLFWNHDGKDQSIVLHLCLRDVHSLIAAFERHGGKKPVVVDIAAKLERGEGSVFLVRLPAITDVNIESAGLLGGTYVVAFIKSSDEAGLVYFFSNSDLSSNGVVAAMPVSVVSLASPQKPALVITADSSSSQRISEIRLGSKTLRPFAFAAQGSPH